MTRSAVFCVILGSSILCASLAAPALASRTEVYNCIPNGQVAGNYFDGMNAFNQPFNGVSTVVTVRYGAVCDTDSSTFNPTTKNLGNFVWAWSMIANSDTNAGGWMQSGFFRNYGTGINDFSQVYDLNTGSIHDVMGAVRNPGDNVQYWQQNIGGTAWRSNVNTTILQSDSNLIQGWSGLSQQFNNETRYLSSDVPGGVGSETNFDSLEVQRYDGTWVSLPNPFLSGVNDNSSRWGGPNPTSSQSFLVWTQNFS